MKLGSFPGVLKTLMKFIIARPRPHSHVDKMKSTSSFVLLVAVIFGVLLLHTDCTVPAVVVRRHVGGPGTCLIKYCSKSSLECVADSQCRKATACNTGCAGKENTDACNLLCELDYGYNSTKYRQLLQCMSDHGCLPVSPDNGVCLANDSDTVKNLTSLAQVNNQLASTDSHILRVLNLQIKGKWWIVRGLNCGQKGWSDGFDFFPCQRDEFVPAANGIDWIDHIAYCGGTNNTCQTPMLFTVANVSMTSPGVMTHMYETNLSTENRLMYGFFIYRYTDPPLVPQNEEWRVLSWPHPDWMLYIYCGSTPTGKYAGQYNS